MTHFISGNQIELLRNGTEYFPALESAIAAANSEIYIQSYIFQQDSVGTRIANALIEAARRGVIVHLLLDGFGSQDLSKTYVKSLQAAGLKLIFYRAKISPWTFKKNRLRRLHQKVVVIDNKIAFVGGINIIDDYNIPHAQTKPNNIPPRIDYAAKIQGNLLPIIVARVQHLWRRMTRLDSFSLLGAVRSKADIAPSKPVSKAGLLAAFVIRDNVLHRHDIEDAYLTAIRAAQSEIIIANAYFVPGRTFRKALIDAAKRGVTVKLLLQGRMEYFLMFATHAFYTEFLKHGIQIYEYRKSFMHSKVAVIDNYWSTVGSSNIDPFSLLLAREANIMVKDRGFACELGAEVMANIQAGAFYIAPQAWLKGNVAKRAASWLAFGLVRLFLGLIGQSDQQ